MFAGPVAPGAPLNPINDANVPAGVEDDREVLVRKRSRHPETVILKECRTELLRLEAAMGIGPVYKAKVDLSSGDDGGGDLDD